MACQIKAVNDHENLKRAFLYDCSATNVETLLNLIRELKAENLVSKDVSIAIVQDDIFILNLEKFHVQSSHVIVDISGSLKKPRVIEDTALIDEMFHEINKQLSVTNGSFIQIEIAAGWCVPTIFGYLINYPVLYYHQTDQNCLGMVDLKVHQVMTNEETLISFSVPNEIYEQNKVVQETVNQWMQHFQNHENFYVKTFIANYPTVIL